MALSDDQFGVDLRLLRDLERQNERQRGSDLSTIERHGEIDLETLQGVNNLKQSLLLRFLTPVGELAPLGHPSYGSRLFDLIGELNTETNRNLAKLFVLQALGDEPRVKEVREVIVSQNRADRARMDISVSVMAIDGNTSLNLVFPFFL